MTKKEMERRIVNLEEQLSALARKQYAYDSKNEGKISEVGTTVDAIENTLNETTETVNMSEETLDYVIGEIIPVQEAKSADLENTIDYILTDIIPSLMGDE